MFLLLIIRTQKVAFISWTQVRRKTTRVASQVSEVTNEQQQTLMPTVINENEPQYLPVREIGEKLDTDNLIRNIALTGPYGSGKSTVLYTLQQDYKKHTYLQISLATLESYDLLERDEKKKDLSSTYKCSFLGADNKQ